MNYLHFYQEIPFGPHNHKYYLLTERERDRDGKWEKLMLLRFSACLFYNIYRCGSFKAKKNASRAHTKLFIICFPTLSGNSSFDVMCEMHAIYHHNLVAFDIFMSKNIEAIDSEMWMAYIQSMIPMNQTIWMPNYYGDEVLANCLRPNKWLSEWVSHFNWVNLSINDDVFWKASQIAMMLAVWLRGRRRVRSFSCFQCNLWHPF